MRRIIVAADCSKEGKTAMAAAVALGARFRAEIEGLFVEDLDLVDVAGHEFVREVQTISGVARTFDQADVESQLKAEAARTRRALIDFASRERVQTNFRVVRGRVASEVITAASGGDLLVLGAFGRPASLSKRPGSTALAAAERAPRSVLLMHPGATIEGRPLVICDDVSERTDRALQVALKLAEAPGNKATLLVVGPAGTTMDQLKVRVAELAGSDRVNAEWIHVTELDLDDVGQQLERTGSDLLIVNADSPSLAGVAGAPLLEKLRCSVLLVR